MSWGRSEWAPYVSVGQKLAMARRTAIQTAKKQKREPSPVELDGRKIAKSFWGQAWCKNLEAYQDFSNRLPRGATYVRNGSVVDLVISPTRIDAIVAGSEPYTVQIEISKLATSRWKAIRSDCSTSIDSLLDLLAGKFSDGVMKRLTDQKTGLFPAPSEIKMHCSCPDYSSCCKHLAAVMYGIGARLDRQPELLFLLRGVDHQELVTQAMAAGTLEKELSLTDGGLGSTDLGALFGIELDSSEVVGSASADILTKEARKTRSRSKAEDSSDTATAAVTPVTGPGKTARSRRSAKSRTKKISTAAIAPTSEAPKAETVTKAKTAAKARNRPVAISADPQLAADAAFQALLTQSIQAAAESTRTATSRVRRKSR